MDAKVDDPPSSECVGVPGGPSPQNGTFSDDLQQRKIDELMKLVFPDDLLPTQYEYPPLGSCSCFECSRATEAAEQRRYYKRRQPHGFEAFNTTSNDSWLAGPEPQAPPAPQPPNGPSDTSYLPDATPTLPIHVQAALAAQAGDIQLLDTFTDVNGNTSLLTTEVTLLPPHLIGSTFLTHCCVVNRNDGPAEPAADNSKKRIEVLEKLLASGALLSNKDANGLTVLQLALQCGDVDVALQLVRILVNLVGVRESKRGSKLTAGDKRLFRAQLEPLLQDSQQARLNDLTLPRFAASAGMIPVVEEWLKVLDVADQFKSDAVIPFRDSVSEPDVSDDVPFADVCMCCVMAFTHLTQRAKITDMIAVACAPKEAVSEPKPTAVEPPKVVTEPEPAKEQKPAPAEPVKIPFEKKAEAVFEPQKVSKDKKKKVKDRRKKEGEVVADAKPVPVPAPVPAVVPIPTKPTERARVVLTTSAKEPAVKPQTVSTAAKPQAIGKKDQVVAVITPKPAPIPIKPSLSGKKPPPVVVNKPQTTTITAEKVVTSSPAPPATPAVEPAVKPQAAPVASIKPPSAPVEAVATPVVEKVLGYPLPMFPVTHTPVASVNAKPTALPVPPASLARPVNVKPPTPTPVVTTPTPPSTGQKLSPTLRKTAGAEPFYPGFVGPKPKPASVVSAPPPPHPMLIPVPPLPTQPPTRPVFAIPPTHVPMEAVPFMPAYSPFMQPPLPPVPPLGMFTPPTPPGFVIHAGVHLPRPPLPSQPPGLFHSSVGIETAPPRQPVSFASPSRPPEVSNTDTSSLWSADGAKPPQPNWSVTGGATSDHLPSVDVAEDDTSLTLDFTALATEFMAGGEVGGRYPSTQQSRLSIVEPTDPTLSEYTLFPQDGASLLFGNTGNIGSLFTSSKW